MELELKHLAPYLSYGLEFFCKDEDLDDFEILPLVKVDVANEELQIGNVNIDLNLMPFHNGLTVSPILRPLSDLEESIEFDFDPVEMFCTVIDSWFVSPNEWWKNCPYEAILKLFECHFDVFGLIEKGLAIDKNTIK